MKYLGLKDTGTDRILTYGERQFDAGIAVEFDGGDVALTTGRVAYLRIPFACTITGWTLVAKESGSIVIDVRKDSYANFPPTSGDSIAGTEKPTLTAQAKNQDVNLSTWTTSLAQGDILMFYIDSVSTITFATLFLDIQKT